MQEGLAVAGYSAMNISIGIIIGILGLLVGSFLNAYIYRLSIGVSVKHGRSFCPHCHQTLAAKDLIPLVSFMMLSGKCRYCHKPISAQYPLVELATALSWVGLYLYFGLTIMTGVYMFWTAVLIVIFVYDFLHQLILDRVTIPAGFGIFITAFFTHQHFDNLVIGALVGGGFFFLQYALTNGRWVGGGDIRLGVLMGLMLGWPGVLFAIGLAYMVGAIVGVTLIAIGKKKMSSQVPFGTFLTLATYASFFIAQPLLDNYFI